MSLAEDLKPLNKALSPLAAIRSPLGLFVCVGCLHDKAYVKAEPQAVYETIFNSELSGKEKCSVCLQEIKDTGYTIKSSS